ncbi:MAG: hypothetical protein M3463_20485, partial [Verrucomicrobiota bacterium]|nr:hypothetical protein [Verrucomicrobiota bacterium]
MNEPAVFGRTFSEGHVELQLNDVIGDLGGDWPLFCGVPLARGSLTDPRHAGVVDADGRAVPAQVRAMATWPGTHDIRWLGVDFQGDPKKRYFLKYGAHPLEQAGEAGDRPFFHQQDNDYVIDTGPAKFIVPETGPLIRRAWLDHSQNGSFEDDELVIANDAGDDLFVIDHRGRKAVIGRDSAPDQVRAEPGITEIQQQGTPLHACIRREGWYVTSEGERVARHITRLHFYRNHSFVRIEHTLVLTHNSNDLWLRDVGIRFAHRLGGRQTVRFAPAQHGSSDGFQALLDDKVQAISLLQDQALFFSRMDKDKDARYAITAYSGDQPRQVAAGALAGDWVGVGDARSSITLTLRNLWQQFPKELHAAPEALTGYLWSSRGGREFDVRRETLLKVWPEEWLNKDYHAGGSYGIYYDRVLKSSAQAQGLAKTHELLLHLHRPSDQARARRVADAFTNPV